MSTHRERALEHVEDFLYHLQEQPNGKARKELMLDAYGHLEEAFIDRYMGHLIRMSPEQLVKVIGYPDPTGEHATNLAMRQAA